MQILIRSASEYPCFHGEIRKKLWIPPYLELSTRSLLFVSPLQKYDGTIPATSAMRNLLFPCLIVTLQYLKVTSDTRNSFSHLISSRIYPTKTKNTCFEMIGITSRAVEIL